MGRQREADVLVIGGGAVGICAAYYLRQRGFSVRVVERDAVCSGASAGNAGLIVPSYSIPLASPGKILKGLKWMFDPESPFSIRPRLDPALLQWMALFHRSSSASCCRSGIPVLRDLNQSGMDLFDALNEAHPSIGLDISHDGFLALFNSRHGREEAREEIELLSPYGIACRTVSAGDAGRMAGGLDTAALGGVFFPGDAHLDPRHFVQRLSAHVRGMGAEIHESTEVIGWKRSGRRITAVETTRGDFVARDIVLAGGAWSPAVVRGLGVRLPMQPAKGYSITFRRPGDFPAIPIGLMEAKVVLTPLGETFRVAGTLEFAGFDPSYRLRRIRAVIRSMTDYFPGVDPSALELVAIWQGFRPCSPDGLPFIGRTRSAENLIVAAGHGMLGITQAPITGRLVSQLAAGDAPDLDVNPLRPDRFRRA